MAGRSPLVHYMFPNVTADLALHTVHTVLHKKEKGSQGAPLASSASEPGEDFSLTSAPSGAVGFSARGRYIPAQ